MLETEGTLLGSGEREGERGEGGRKGRREEGVGERREYNNK